MIEKIAVIGAGTMGHAIAESFALGGMEVNLYDLDEAQINRGVSDIKAELELLAAEGMIGPDQVQSAFGRIKTFTSLADAVCDRDFVVEAAPEKMEIKQDLFHELDRLCPPRTIFGTNTSSLPMTPMMERIGEERKKRVIVTHWYNPAHIMPLVELSFFGNMPQDIYDEVEAAHRKIGKQTAKVLKEIPGLIANRIQQGVAREVFSLIQQGVADAAEIDKALKFGPAFRYATTGQLEVADFGGLDIWCIVGDNLLGVMDASKEANPVLREKVAQGKLGLKSGEGFFVYPPETSHQTREKFLKKLIHQLKACSYYAE